MKARGVYIRGVVSIVQQAHVPSHGLTSRFAPNERLAYVVYARLRHRCYRLGEHAVVP